MLLLLLMLPRCQAFDAQSSPAAQPPQRHYTQSRQPETTKLRRSLPSSTYQGCINSHQQKQACDEHQWNALHHEPPVDVGAPAHTRQGQGYPCRKLDHEQSSVVSRQVELEAGALGYTDFVWKPHVPMEHSGAKNCSLKEDMEATLYILVSMGGHLNPKDVNLCQHDNQFMLDSTANDHEVTAAETP
jgi:hypothetical protein